MEIVDTWEKRGSRLATPDGEVWLLDQPPAHDDDCDPLLVLHGFPSSSFDWRHVLPALAHRRRVVLFDFIGFGLSAKPDRRYSIEMQADAAGAVASHLGLERVALLTHDMGDTVGGELLARALDGTLGFSVSRRVLTNGSIYVEMAQLTAGQQLLLSLDDARIDLGDDGSAYQRGMAETFSADHPPSDEELQAQWVLQSRNGGQTLLPRTIRYVEDRRANEARYTGAIETHPAPLGVVWGAVDPVAVHAMTDRLLTARPGTPLVTLEGVAHWPMIESPDAFATAVLAFLDQR